MGLLDELESLEEAEELPAEEEEIEKKPSKKKRLKEKKKKKKKKEKKPPKEKKKREFKAPSLPKIEKPKRPERPPKEKKVKKEKEVIDYRKYLPKTFPADLELAPLWKRFAAYCIDLVILFFAVGIPFLLTFLIIQDMIAIIPGLIYLFGIPSAYFVILEANTGQTFGKKKMSIKTVNHRGETPTPDQIKKSSLAKAIIIWNIIDALGLLQTKNTTRQRTSQHTRKYGLFVVEVPKEPVDYEEEEEGPFEYEEEEIKKEEPSEEKEVPEEEKKTPEEEEKTEE